LRNALEPALVLVRRHRLQRPCAAAAPATGIAGCWGCCVWSRPAGL